MNIQRIVLPSNDVRILLPLGIFDKDVEILFRTEEAIDSAIRQLQQIKESIKTKGD